MADLRQTKTNNQRRVLNAVVAEGITAADINSSGGALCATLPPGCLVISTYVISEGGDGQASVQYAGTDIATDLDLTLGVSYNFTPVYQVGGGDIVVVPGSTAPTVGEYTLVVVYTDTDKKTGEYTKVK